MISRSLKVPGSDSSALHAMYLAPGVFGTKLHFAGREARAAATAQPGGLDLFDDLVRGHLGERLLPGLA